MSGGFTCLAVPGGPIAAFRLSGDFRMVECLSTVEDQTMDRYCHFFPTVGACQAASPSSFKVNDVDDDYTDPKKYWTKARATLQNQPPVTPPPSPTTTSPPTQPPGSSTVAPPATTIAPAATTAAPQTTPTPPTSTAAPLTNPPIQFETITPDWSCQLHQDKNLYAAAHIVNNTYECLSVGEGCHYSKTNVECDQWLQRESACWLTNTCTTNIRIKVLGTVTAPNTTTVAPLTTPAPTQPATSTNLLSLALLVCAGVVLGLVVIVLWRRRRQLLRQASSLGQFDLTGTSKASKHQLVPYQPEPVKAPQGKPRGRARTATTFIQGTGTPDVSGVFVHPQQVDAGDAAQDEALPPLDMGNLALWQLDAADVVVSKTLHVGTRATVSLATLKQKTVVVKTLNAANASDRKAMQVFVNGMQILSTLESPYIVTMIGCCWSGGHGALAVTLVLEYMSWGDLRSYLTSVGVVAWETKLDWAHAIAQGVVYLHSMELLHQAIDASNVLIDSHFHPKLANVTATTASSTKAAPSDLATIAPEVLEGDDMSEAADVYAIGMLLLELDTQHPFEMASHDIVVDEIDGTWHDRKLAAMAVSFTNLCPVDVRDLAIKCVAADPAARPSVLDVASALDPYDLATRTRSTMR